MQRDVRVYLTDIIAACDRVQEFSAGKNLNVYLSDELLRSAVERQLQIVGEAVSQAILLSHDIAESIPDHRRIIAFRHRLVHAYGDIDHEVVWTAVEHDLPLLRAQAKALLKALDAEDVSE